MPVAGGVRIEFDQGQLRLLARDNPDVAAAMEILSSRVLQEMKARCPVSPVQPVYATPRPDGAGRAAARG